MGKRVPFTLTLVTYDDSEPHFGIVMALFTLTPIFIVVALTSNMVVTTMFAERATAKSISTYVGYDNPSYLFFSLFASIKHSSIN